MQEEAHRVAVIVGARRCVYQRRLAIFVTGFDLGTGVEKEAYDFAVTVTSGGVERSPSVGVGECRVRAAGQKKANQIDMAIERRTKQERPSPVSLFFNIALPGREPFRNCRGVAVFRSHIDILENLHVSRDWARRAAGPLKEREKRRRRRTGII
jgi:hypothetical protein